MRILIDLQACQSTGSRTRGIGRYSMSLAKAMVQRASSHDLRILLSAAFPETIGPIRNEFAGLLSHEQFHTWFALSGVSGVHAQNAWRRRASEMLREHAYRQFQPDLVHVSSLFEGWIDDAVTDIQSASPIQSAVTLYDLIPLIHREHYLRDEKMSSWYYRKLQALKNADLLLAISNSSRSEALDYLQLPNDHVVNISSAVDDRFFVAQYAPEQVNDVLTRHGLRQHFIMYTGGIDLRKNIDGLIRAYAQLPLSLRAHHQLAIVCSVHPEEKERLLQLAAQQGLEIGSVVMTGFVPDEELPILYHACRLFVFPSWHEGFGLPALEAMTCGAPVIAANTSSLPEVIGRADALFDPFSQHSITEKMAQALSDDAFRLSLREHGLVQCKKFSWDESARLSIAAFEASDERQRAKNTIMVAPQFSQKPRLAYVSPLPPEQTGVADYSAELLPELARYYDIDLISDQKTISTPWLSANFPLRSVAWFEQNAHQFDRIMYHFGNSPFHGHMFALMKKHPGVLVLHDFYLSNAVSHLDYLGVTKGAWFDALYESHGYNALIENKNTANIHQIIWKYPCSLPVIRAAQAVIVHSQFSKNLAKKWYGDELTSDWSFIPHLRCLPEKFDRIAAKQALSLSDDDFLVCAFGMLGPTKLNHRLLQAWIDSGLAQNDQCHLVFVGQNDGAQYGAEMVDQIKRANCGDRIRITGFADPAVFRRYLMAADAAVQLRTMSRGETSGTVLDCMAYGVPTIINQNGTMAELPDHALLKLPDEFSDQELVNYLLNLFEDTGLRGMLGNRSVEHIAHAHQPYAIAREYANAIERSYTNLASRGSEALLRKLAAISETALPTDADLSEMARSVAANTMLAAQNRLLIDVTTLAQVDAKSGIQRVVRAILSALLTSPLFAGRVEPVILTEHGLKYARGFTCRQFGLADLNSGDDLLELSSKDIFLGLDLNCGPVVQYPYVLQRMRTIGVKVYFVVYDILPVISPHFFEKDLSVIFEKWIHVLAQNADGAICISNAVAVELQQWIDTHYPELGKQFGLEHFHLGADIESSMPVIAATHFDTALENVLQDKTCFLMVGTVEPRKGHEYALDAMEEVWRAGVDACLVIVGGQGWKTEALARRIEVHPENQRRLFWLKGIDDQKLAELYRRSSCLLMTSWGEGFGLPLIEAARYELAVLARKLPVFEEICGNFISYFEGESPSALAHQIQRWLQLFAKSELPQIQHMPWLTWQESAKQLCAAVSRFSQKKTELIGDDGEPRAMSTSKY